jgi:hypothetical protein
MADFSSLLGAAAGWTARARGPRRAGETRCWYRAYGGAEVTE